MFGIQVRIDIERDGDRGMPEPFLHDLGMDAHVAGVAVSEPMQRYPPFLEEGPTTCVRLRGCKGEPSAWATTCRGIVPLDPQLQQFLDLGDSPAA